MRKDWSKAQSGMNAAILVAILAALIIIYIIFLPSEQRLGLIGENVTDDKDNDGIKDSEVLIEEKSLTMEVIGAKEREYTLPSVNLYTRTEPEELWKENSIYVKNGLFDKEDKTIDFKVDDPDTLNNILISFNAKKSKGRLILTLNGYEIFNNKIEKVNVDPIKVSNDYLAENNELFNNDIDKVNVDPIKISNDYLAENNELIFSVSGVGIAFWSTNEYLLENFKIVAQKTDTSTQTSQNKFHISDSDNIEKAELIFLPDCQQGNVGILEVLINKNIVYSSVPDCGTPYPLSFSPFNLISGENTVTFRADTGRYLIDQVKVKTDLKDQPSYTYFFDLKSDDLKDIKDDKKELNLSFYFADDREDKEAEIIINGARAKSMPFHHEAEWSTIIPYDYLETGSNSLKIIPKENLEIRKFILSLQDE